MAEWMAELLLAAYPEVPRASVIVSRYLCIRTTTARN